jgi:hypothetical protein
MSNIEKLIAITKINHAGTEATEAKLEAMARVIKCYDDGIREMRLNLHLETSEDWSNAVCELDNKAEEIAGAGV